MQVISYSPLQVGFRIYLGLGCRIQRQGADEGTSNVGVRLFL